MALPVVGTLLRGQAQSDERFCGLWVGNRRCRERARTRARTSFDFRCNSRHTEDGPYCAADWKAVLESTLYRNGMFGKRGETPPLPRNCEARTFFGG